MRTPKVLKIWNLLENIYLGITYHLPKTPFQFKVIHPSVTLNHDHTVYYTLDIKF